MSEENRVDLKELFKGMQDQMKAQLSTNRQFITHPGSKGDALENAWIDYLKQEWDGVNDVALATLDWVHWYNHERLHSTNGYVSPVDAENIYYCSLIPSGYAA